VTGFGALDFRDEQVDKAAAKRRNQRRGRGCPGLHLQWNLSSHI
jgi:hypothetical protein